MRHQTAPIGQPVDGRRRLDPFALPASFVIPSVGGLPGGATSVTVTRTSVAVTSRAGTKTIPISSFRGVAVRMQPTEGGDLAILVELNHLDPSLSQTLMVADDLVDVAADWKAWARCLGLPMLLIEADGSITRPVTTLGPIEVASPKPRRMHSYFANRRPRFLARRKTGWEREQSVLDGAEIIARD